GAGGAEVCSFQRIDGDVDFRVDLTLGPPAAEGLTHVEHGSLVALALADDHRAAHLEPVELFTHRLDGHLIGVFSFAVAHRAAGGADSSGYFNEARLMVSGRFNRPIELLRILHLPTEWSHVLTPLGFASDERDRTAMVPTYPPGFPAHLAIIGMIGGWSRAPF